MKTFHKILVVISEIAIINFLLFFIIGLLIGGDAVNGYAENGHYYLANHGEFKEVNYFIFMYSKIHVYTVFVTHSLFFIAGFLYWITGGGSIRPESQSKPLHSRKTFSSTVPSFFWLVADSIEEIFWIVLDSWRKPDGEFFVRLFKEQCIRALKTGTNNVPRLYQLDKPLWGYFSGNHFYLQKWSYRPFFRDGGVRPVLSGKFSSTPQGTYIRMWHRFTTIGILFLTAWFGTALSLLTFYIFTTNAFSFQPHIKDTTFKLLALTIVPVFYISTFFISLQVGSFFGRANNLDIVKFVKEALDNHRASDQLLGGRLSQDVQGEIE